MAPQERFGRIGEIEHAATWHGRVFIHLFLNTTDLSRCEGVRPFLEYCDKLVDLRRADHGVGRLLDELLEYR